MSHSLRSHVSSVSSDNNKKSGERVDVKCNKLSLSVWFDRVFCLFLKPKRRKEREIPVMIMV